MDYTARIDFGEGQGPCDRRAKIHFCRQEGAPVSASLDSFNLEFRFPSGATVAKPEDFLFQELHTTTGMSIIERSRPPTGTLDQKIDTIRAPLQQRERLAAQDLDFHDIAQCNLAGCHWTTGTLKPVAEYS